MTPTLAKYIGDTYTVVTHIETGDVLGSGFDATVWKNNVTGKLTVSMQGTTGLQDFLTDVNLAVFASGHRQLVDMVNWWLRISTPTDQSVVQIKTKVAGGAVGDFFELAAPAQGTGLIPAADLVNGIEVNGHSLGGYLATAFTRLFGSQAHVQHTSTFNSAGFATMGGQILISPFHSARHKSTHRLRESVLSPVLIATKHQNTLGSWKFHQTNRKMSRWGGLWPKVI
ncbi:MAG: hypothetical protein IAE92_09190 [Burkholderiaceae bacterium]|nr:hypothetical protein [Burkholderiaceae bacterium]